MDSLRTYRVRSLHEALQLIREDLGPEAAVLHTREVSAGWFGWRRELEVTASADICPPSRLPTMFETTVEEELTLTNATQEAFGSMTNQNASVSAASKDLRWQDETVAPQQNLQLNLLEGALSGLNLPPDETEEDVESPLAEKLRSAGFAEDYVAETVAAWQLETPPLHQSNEVSEHIWLARRVMLDLPVQGSLRVPRNRRMIVAVVGATGVGKTTSLAKLAAEFRLQQHRRVGLVTVDTYRIGAVEQLRTYAEIMEVPMEVVSSPREMRDALVRLADCELVLIDTAGRSPLDAAQMQELQEVLAAASPDEVYLVASAVAEADSLYDVAQRFMDVGANRLLLTKSDEARYPGRIFEFLRRINLPVTYVANGQNVPEDLRPADSQRLAQWLIGARTSHQL